jgi:hypothetical protein
VVGLNRSADVHYHLGVVYQSKGESRWARYHFEAIADLEGGGAYAKDVAARLKALSQGN